MAQEPEANIELPTDESSSRASQRVGGFLEADSELPVDESVAALRKPELSAAMLGIPRPGGQLEVAVEWNGALPQTISGWIDLDNDGEMARNELVLTDAVMKQARETFRVTLPPGSPSAPELRLFTNDAAAEVGVRPGKGAGSCGTSTDFYVAGFPQAVFAMEVFDDGSGPGLYVAGDRLTAIGNQLAGAVNKWDGSAWSTIDASPYGRIGALAVFDDGGGDALYAGGYGLRKWDGSTWGTPSPSLNGFVNSMVVFDDGTGAALFVGGEFTTAGGVLTVNYIAKWDGSAWSALGTGMNAAVNGLFVWDDGSGAALYAAGDFSTAGGTPANGVAEWNGSTWSALGTGVNGYASTFAAYDDGSGEALYVGGQFFNAGGVSVDGVAKWDGSSWSHPGFSGPGSIPSLLVYDDGGGLALFMCGLGGSVQKWDGSSISLVGAGVGSSAYILEAFDSGSGPELFIGGSFSSAGGIWAQSIAKWDGSSWSALASGAFGMNNAMFCFVSHDDGGGSALYAGGQFTYAGATSTRGVARWNGAGWSPLTGGATIGPVHSLLSHDDGSGTALYAGGAFGPAGVARWDGSNWSTVGGGLNDWVASLAEFDDGFGPALYAGGRFTTAGGSPADYIAKWDGSTWSALSSGMDSMVRALAVFDDGSGPALYAGGDFTSAGGSPANYIAKWDGSSWSAVSTGMSGYVRTLGVYDDGTGTALYAGGHFTTAGGSPANYIAKWDGAAWSALGSGLSYIPYTMVVHDNGDGPALFVGGTFTTAGGISARRVAAWDGATWSAVLSSASTVHALASHDAGNGPELWLGGYFTIVDGAVASRITKWSCTCECGQTIQPGEWTLIGLGCSPTVSTVENVFGDDLAPADYGSTWIVIERDEDANAYHPLALSDTLFLGEGYWVKTLGSPASLDANGNPASTVCPGSSEYNECFDTALAGADGNHPNMKGFPFSSSIGWADVRFVDGGGTEYSPAQAELAAIASKNMYQWNGSSYQTFDGETPGMEGTLDEFTGFWVKAHQDLTLRMPTAAALAARRADEGGAGTGLGSDEWYLRLVVADGDTEDAGNLIGRLADSVDGLDSHDLDEMAPFGDQFLTAVLPHPEWATDEWAYTSDYREARPGAGGTWELEIRSDSARELTLSWQGAGLLVDDILSRSRLVDEETQAVIDPSAQSSVTLATVGPTHRMSWRVNAVPQVDLNATYDTLVGEGLIVVASFSDEDPTDTHTASVAWGDGTVSEPLIDQIAGTATSSHVYVSPGSFNAELCVSDDFGSQGCRSFVVNAAADPTIIFVDGFETGDILRWSIQE